MLENAWIIPVLPLISMALIMLFTHRNRALSAGISITAVGVAFVYAWIIALTIRTI